MNLNLNLIMNVYSIIILAVIWASAVKLIDKKSFQDKLYILMLLLTAFMLSIDILSRFDGESEPINLVLNHTGNFLIFMLSPVLPSIWLLYVHFQVSNDEESTKKLLGPLLAVNALSDILLILTQFNGWYYHIDANNIYHRGPLFLLPAFFTIGLMAVAFMLTVKNRKWLEKRSFLSLTFFAVPPFLCIILQIAYYGVSLILNGVAVSLLVVFLNIQNHSIHTDHLTGISNRKNLDAYLNKKINTNTARRGFAAIMLDLDNFKTINDAFGHDMGDRALIDAARLLKKCVRANDFIARYGGDEFVILLDISSRSDLEAMIERIAKNAAEFSESGFQPYQIRFSMGYALYDFDSRISAEEFLKQVDFMMYENKQDNKNKTTSFPVQQSAS